MADLPSVPDAALTAMRAVMDDLYGGSPFGAADDHLLLDAAWPHMFAAALRHVADNDTDRAVQVARGRLHVLADRAIADVSRETGDSRD